MIRIIKPGRGFIAFGCFALGILLASMPGKKTTCSDACNAGRNTLQSGRPWHLRRFGRFGDFRVVNSGFRGFADYVIRHRHGRSRFARSNDGEAAQSFITSAPVQKGQPGDFHLDRIAIVMGLPQDFHAIERVTVLYGFNQRHQVAGQQIVEAVANSA